MRQKSRSKSKSKSRSKDRPPRRRRGGRPAPRVREEDMTTTEGVLEIISDGYGFLRSAKRNFLASPDDIYVPAGILRRTGLRQGSLVKGKVAPPRKPGQRPSLHVVEEVDGTDLETYRHRRPFKQLTTIDPHKAAQKPST